MLGRRRWATEHLDGVRRLLVNEPRGHADMYGGIRHPTRRRLGRPRRGLLPQRGLSTACGHGTIALVTWAVETGRIEVVPGARSVAVTVDVPSGRLACGARLDADGRVEAVRFRNVPSFVIARDVTVRTSGGLVTLDVAFGGAFYGTVEASALGLGIDAADLPRLIALQRELRPALERSLDVVHPVEPDLAGIYGVIFWERLGPTEQRNVAVFADGEIDRSPCGSGTSARLAVLHARGEIAVGERFHHRSIVDSSFDAWVVDEGTDRRSAPVGHHGSRRVPPIRTGESMFALDPRDPLGTGFLLR